MSSDPPALAVSFDFGQTLASLDPEMLARRVAERGFRVDPARVDAAQSEAWRAYGEAIRQGVSGHPWKILMRRMLEASGHDADGLDGVVDWLWTEQPGTNLWRRPIPGMIALVDDLRRLGIPVAVLSNSEGRLAELIAELGWTDRLGTVADSGRLGFEKPGREIFAWTADRLGVSMDRVVHVGDSFEADVSGALAAGMRAIWFVTDPDVSQGDRGALPPRVRACRDAEGVRSALAGWGIPVR